MIAVSVEESFCSSYSSLSCGWWALSTSSSSLQSLSLSSLPLLRCSLSCDFVISITFIIIMITIAHITPSSSLHLYLWVWVKLLWYPLESCLIHLNADSDRNSNAVTLIDIEWIKSAKWSVIDAWKLIIDRPGGEVDTFQEAAQVKWGDMEFIHVF